MKNGIAGACDQAAQFPVDCQAIDAVGFRGWKLAPILKRLKYMIGIAVPHYLHRIARACFALEQGAFRLRDSTKQCVGMLVEREEEVLGQLLNKG